MGKFKEIIMRWRCGAIRDIYKEAVETAKEFECAVRFEFNGINIIVDQTCDFDLNREDFELIMDSVGSTTELDLCY